MFPNWELRNDYGFAWGLVPSGPGFAATALRFLYETQVAGSRHASHQGLANGEPLIGR